MFAFSCTATGTRSRLLCPRNRGSPRAPQVFHTDVAVKMTDKPSQALRTGRRVSSMWQAIEAVKTGAADCVDFGRQHRRADGDGEVLPAHDGADRPSGDRRALADDARRIDRARRRGDDRRRRAASGRPGGDGRGDGANRVRHRLPDGRPAQRRGRGDQGRRGGQGGRPAVARRQPAQYALSRLRRRRRPRQGRRRRVRHRGLYRQYRAEDGGRHRAPTRPVHARRVQPQPHVAHRLPVRPQGPRRPARANGAASARRRVPRP